MSKVNYEDYENEYEDDDHARARERKVERRSIDRLMRGNRSVFTMRDASKKRAKRIIEEED